MTPPVFDQTNLNLSHHRTASMNTTLPTLRRLATLLRPVVGRLAGAALVVLLGWTAPAARAVGDPPDRMSYQGFLVDGSGVALATNTPANFPVVFRIYDDAEAGNLLWAEQQVVTVDKGYFSVILGEGAAVTSEPHGTLPEVFAGSTAASRFISTTVTVSGTAHSLLPRLRLLSSPYAFLATQATRLVNASTGVPFLSAAAGNVTVDGNLRSTSGVSGVTGQFSGVVQAASFQGNGTIPVGGIIMWSGALNQIPSGWALCNGQIVAGAQTPNLQDRFIVGAGSGYGVGNVGGAASMTLSVAQMPRHSHQYLDTWWAEVDGWDSTFGRTVGSRSGSDWDNYMFGGTRTTAQEGGNQPFDNRPPYYALAFIMRVQ